jgi:hypothetical protein
MSQAASLPTPAHDVAEMLDVLLDIYSRVTRQDVLDYMEALRSLAND